MQQFDEELKSSACQRGFFIFCAGFSNRLAYCSVNCNSHQALLSLSWFRGAYLLLF
jgi:hypothetical protein